MLMCIKMEGNQRHTMREIEIPKGVEAEIDGDKIKIIGERGQVTKRFPRQHIEIMKMKDKIIIKSDSAKKKYKALLGTTTGDINNMIKGVTVGIEYRLKICYSHFPVNLKVQNNKVIIDNFLGEKYPRKANILDGVDVDIKGQEIFLRGADKENVAQSAANLEQTTKIKDLDPRVFQDGIYIVEKDGKPC